MAYSSDLVKTKRDGIVRLISGDPTTYIANFNVGDFTFEQTKSALVVIRDRNTIAGARRGDDPEINFSFSCHLRALNDNANDVLLDFVNGSLGSATLTSTGGNGYEPFLCTVEFEMDGTSLGDSKVYKATFAKCQLTATITEGEPNSIAIAGVCLGGVTFS